MRITRDEWSLEIARVTSLRATCLRRQVGCVLLDKHGFVLATGYNGVAAGLPHCNDGKERQAWPGELEFETYYPNSCAGSHSPSGTDLDACQAIHAEQNALLQCRDVQAIETCYVTVSPCITCVKLLLNTGCRRIVYAAEYPQPTAGDLWRKAGRLWELKS